MASEAQLKAQRAALDALRTGFNAAAASSDAAADAFNAVPATERLAEVQAIVPAYNAVVAALRSTGQSILAGIAAADAALAALPPPPPAPTGTRVTTFTVVSPNSGTVEFTKGQVFRKGDVAAGRQIVVSGAAGQVIKRSTRPDGSLFHGIISGAYQSVANVPQTITLAVGSTPSGRALTAADIAAARPTDSFQAGTYGTVALADLLATPFRTFISGPEMVEAHYHAKIAGTQLAVWFHVRLWRTGLIWVRSFATNGYLGVTPTNYSYIPKITIGGAVVYDNDGKEVTHCNHTRVMAEGWHGRDPGVIYRDDIDYFDSTLAVPHYGWRKPSSGTLDYINSRPYQPTLRGAQKAAMAGAGFAEHIGLLPLWGALYCTSGDPRARAAVLDASSSLNSFGLDWRSPVTDDYPSLVTYGTYTVFGETGVGEGGKGSNDWVVDTDAGSLQLEVNHQSHDGFLAYAISGDYWHLETLLGLATFCFLSVGSVRGTGTRRLLLQQDRGIGWELETLGQFCAIAPDDHPRKAEFKELLAFQYEAYKGMLDARPECAVLTGQPLFSYYPAYSIAGAVPPWMSFFWVAANGYISDLEPLADTSKLIAVRDSMYKFPVGMAGRSGVKTEFPFTHFGANYLAVIAADNSGSNFFADWGKVYTASNGGAVNDTPSNTLAGAGAGAPDDAWEGYWGNGLPALAYAVDHGAPGAAEAWARIMGAGNADKIGTRMDDVPIWGIVPRRVQAVAQAPAPAPSTALEWDWNKQQAVGEWRDLPNTALSSFKPAVPPVYGEMRFAIEAWGGFAVDQRTGRLYLFSPIGHADGCYTGILYVETRTSSPHWGEKYPSEAGIPIAYNSAYTPKGFPNSSHLYHSQVIAGNRLVRMGTGSVFSSGFPKPESNGFNIDVADGTNGLDGPGTWPGLPLAGAGDGSTCLDAAGNLLVFLSNYQVWSIDPSTKAITVLSKAPPRSYLYTAPACDTSSGKVLLLGSYGGFCSDLFDPSTGLFEAFPLTGPGAAAVQDTPNGHGLGYDPIAKLFFVRLKAAGGAVYSIDRRTGYTTLFATTGGDDIPVTGEKNNVFGLWQYDEGTRGFFYMPNGTTNIRHLRTH